MSHTIAYHCIHLREDHLPKNNKLPGLNVSLLRSSTVWCMVIAGVDLCMENSRARAATVFSPPDRLSIGRNLFPGAIQL